MFVQQKNLAAPSETEIRNAALNEYFSEQDPRGRPYVQSIPAPAIHVPFHIAFYTVGPTTVCGSEETTVGKTQLPTLLNDVKGMATPQKHQLYLLQAQKAQKREKDKSNDLHGGRSVRINTPIPMNPIRIGNINDPLVGRKTNPVRPAESIGHDTDLSRLRLVAIHLVWQFGRRSDTLLVPVDRIREPDGPVAVSHDVVWRVERFAVVALD